MASKGREHNDVKAQRTVLVTGGAGFAGGYLVRELLDRGYKVVVFDLADFRAETRFVIGDKLEQVIAERGSVDNFPRILEVVMRHRPSVIAHLGAIMDIGLLDRNPMLALKVNAEGTLNIFEAARLHGVRRVVMFSTIAVIGKKMYEPIDANHPTITARVGPLGAYSAAKVAAEAFAFAYNQSFGLDTRIVRPSALYGFGMSWFAPNYIKQIVEPAVLGEPVRLPSGGQVPRDYAHVSDLATLTAALLEAPDDSDRIFFGATGQPLRTGGDVGRIVRELVPGSVVEIGDSWTKVDRAELPFRGQISIANAEQQLGWKPRYARLEDGIGEYVERLHAYRAAGGTLTPRPSLVNAPGS
jgi:nucleoside-diphosphate-sugar epimerase